MKRFMAESLFGSSLLSTTLLYEKSLHERTKITFERRSEYEYEYEYEDSSSHEDIAVRGLVSSIHNGGP